MVEMDEEDDRVPRVGHGLEAGCVMEARQHADVDHIVLQVAEDLRRVAQPDRDVHLRIALAVGVDHLDDVEGADCAELELPASEFAAVVQQVVGLDLERGQLPRDRQQLMADAGEFDAMAAAMEELDLVLPLQALDLRRQRRLREPERARRRAEAAVTGDGEEGAELGGGHVLRRSMGPADRRILDQSDDRPVTV